MEPLGARAPAARRRPPAPAGVHGCDAGHFAVCRGRPAEPRSISRRTKRHATPASAQAATTASSRSRGASGIVTSTMSGCVRRERSRSSSSSAPSDRHAVHRAGAAAAGCRRRSRPRARPASRAARASGCGPLRPAPTISVRRRGRGRARRAARSRARARRSARRRSATMQISASTTKNDAREVAACPRQRQEAERDELGDDAPRTAIAAASRAPA